MKKFFKCFCVGALSVITISLSGCVLSFDPDEPTSGLESIDGFKVCYNDNNYQLDDTFERYSGHILTSLVNVFGMPINSGVASAPLSSNAKNYDRIRVQYNGSTAISTAWNWTFAQSFAGVASQAQQSDVLAYYTSDKSAVYTNEYKNIYQNALAVALMQIASGQTPQDFVIEVNETTGQTKVFANASKTEEVNTDYLQAEKTKFKEFGTYVGLTLENVSTFKNYILSTVIGNNIINTQYDAVITTAGNKTYSALLDEILALDTDLEKDFLTPYPACTAKDVTDTSLYPISSGADPLQNIPAYEYQGITLMPNRTLEILSASLMLGADSAMAIDIGVYYYNFQTNTQTVLFEGTANLKANQQTEFFMPFDELVVMDKFNNTEAKINGALPITNQNGLSKHFAYQNGAVVDSNQSYLAITFKVQGEQNEYMPFKVAISSLFIGE